MLFLFVCIIALDPDPDTLGPQEFGFLDPDPQKYADPRIRMLEKISTKTSKKKIFLKTQIQFEKREIIKIS